MPPRPPQTSPLVIVLAVVAGLGVCAIAAAVMVPTMLGRVGAWPVLAGGSIALIAALVGLLAIENAKLASARGRVKR
jgi:uncharacterized membrane protein